MDEQTIETKGETARLRTSDSLVPVALSHDPYWAIEERSARQLLAQLRSTSAHVHVVEVEAASGAGAFGESDFEVVDGVAVISIVGPMTKSPTSFSSACSTVRCRRQIRAAAKDDRVKAILLRIDSPGGSVSGTDDLAQDVANARARKTVYAYAEDDCCSAAFWVASQATKVFCSKTARVGSIGVYTTVEDWSRLYENAGVKVHLLSTGRLKGAGADGVPVSQEQLDEWQAVVDEFNGHFLGAVAKGRRMSRAKVDALADGRVWIGERAVEAGLADEVATFDAVLASLSSKKTTRAVSGEELPHAGMPLADQSEAALAAVRGLTSRIAGLKATREAEGRSLGERPIAHITEALTALDELRTELSALVSDPEAEARQLIARSYLAS